MPDPKRIRIYCEGPDDRAVLQALQKSHVLADHFDLANPSGGKDELARDVAPFISPTGVAGRAIILRDHDQLSAAAVGTWFAAELRQRFANTDVTVSPEPVERVTTVVITDGNRAGRAVVIPVGLPELSLCHQYYLTGFAMDDYLLGLAHDGTVYEELREREKEMQSVSHPTAIKKLAEVLDLMRHNGIPVEHSKRALHIFRAVTGFRASPATFAERLVAKAIGACGPDAIRERMQPLLADIDRAERWLV